MRDANGLAPSLDNGDHDGHDGGVVEKGTDGGNGNHETELGPHHCLGLSQQFAHVPIESTRHGNAMSHHKQDQHRK